MQPKAKVKGAKRLARRAAERASNLLNTLRSGSTRAQQIEPFRTARAQVVHNAPSVRRVPAAPAFAHLNDRVDKLTGILSKRVDNVQGRKPFYADLQFTGPGGKMPITLMPATDLLTAMNSTRRARLDCLKAAAARYNEADRKVDIQRAAVACAWTVVLESEISRRDPSFAKRMQMSGIAPIQPTPGEIAAYPTLFVG